MKKIIIKLLFKYTTLLRKAIYIGLGKLDKIAGKSKPGIYILCYHSISSNNWFHGVSLNQLKEQIKYLVNSYKIISLEDVEKIIRNKLRVKEQLFVITIDDGYKDVYKTKDFFKKLNIKPALFVLSEGQAVNRKELDNNLEFLNSSEILNLKKDGWTIGNHSATHSNFSLLDEGQIENEVVRSKDKLEKEFGFKIKYFAYPKGIYNKKVLKYVKEAGYNMALSMDDGDIRINPNLLILPRIGINRSHNLAEFKVLFSPSVQNFRMFIKKGVLKI